MSGRAFWGRLALAAASAALVGLLVLPLLALVAGLRPTTVAAAWQHPLTVPALVASLVTTAQSLLVLLLLGTPLAWWLARAREARLARLVDALVQLPAVVPPAVAGLALLFTFGRHGLLGAQLARVGIEIAFTSTAVVMAQVFVAAPFFVGTAAAAFAAVPERLLVVARTLGATPTRAFFHVALPLARRGVLAAVALAWARALGEFGATLMFAGSLSGRTQTLPLAIYAALESDPEAARALAALLVAVAVGLLVCLRALGTGGAWGRRAGLHPEVTRW